MSELINFYLGRGREGGRESFQKVINWNLYQMDRRYRGQIDRESTQVEGWKDCFQ